MQNRKEYNLSASQLLVAIFIIYNGEVLRLSIAFHVASFKMLFMTLSRPWLSGLFSWPLHLLGPSSAQRPSPACSVTIHLCQDLSWKSFYKKHFLGSLLEHLQLSFSSEWLWHKLLLFFMMKRTLGSKGIIFKKLKTWRPDKYRLNTCQLCM